MAKVWQDPGIVYERSYAAAHGAADDLLALVQKKLKNRSVHRYATGHLASTYRIDTEEVSPDGVVQYIRSDERYARAIEEGAWVGGRGPHISGSGKGRDEVRAATQRNFGRYMTKRLKS